VRLEAQVKGLVLRFLEKMYPDGLTVKFIEALLYDWGIFCTEEELLKNHINYLISKGYVEAHDIELPAPVSKIKKVRLTPKGKALLSGEFIDSNISLEV
jgi:hypothetical protein